MNLLTYELINDLKYCVSAQELCKHAVNIRAQFECGLISNRDYDMLYNLYSVRLAELYAEALKKRFEKEYNIYF